MGTWKTLDTEKNLEVEVDVPTGKLLFLRCRMGEIPPTAFILKKVKEICSKSISYGTWNEYPGSYLQARITYQITSKR